MSISVSGKTISINGTKAEFHYAIKDFIEIEKSLIIVLLEVPFGKQFNQNIFCIDRTSNILWQVGKPDDVEKGDDQPYTYIDVSQDGRLIAGDSLGVDYCIDLRTGIPEFQSVSK